MQQWVYEHDNPWSYHVSHQLESASLKQWYIDMSKDELRHQFSHNLFRCSIITEAIINIWFSWKAGNLRSRKQRVVGGYFHLMTPTVNVSVNQKLQFLSCNLGQDRMFLTSTEQQAKKQIVILTKLITLIYFTRVTTLHRDRDNYVCNSGYPRKHFLMYLLSVITEYLIVATMAQNGKGNWVLKPLQDEGQGPLTKQEI